jgi:hypothetical protein
MSVPCFAPRASKSVPTIDNPGSDLEPQRFRRIRCSLGTGIGLCIGLLLVPCPATRLAHTQDPWVDVGAERALSGSGMSGFGIGVMLGVEQARENLLIPLRWVLPAFGDRRGISCLLV